MCAPFFGKTEIKPSPASPDFRYLYIFFALWALLAWCSTWWKRKKSEIADFNFIYLHEFTSFRCSIVLFFSRLREEREKKQGKSRARFSRWVGYLVSLCFALTLNMYKFQMWITHAFTHSTVSHSLTHSLTSISISHMMYYYNGLAVHFWFGMCGRFQLFLALHSFIFVVFCLTCISLVDLIVKFKIFNTKFAFLLLWAMCDVRMSLCDGAHH